MEGLKVPWERRLDYVLLIVVLVSLGMMVERAPLEATVGLGFLDWVVMQGRWLSAYTCSGALCGHLNGRLGWRKSGTAGRTDLPAGFSLCVAG